MSRQALVILIIFFKHNLSLSMCLRWLHESLLGPEVNKLLHLAIVLVNSSSKNKTQVEDRKDVISLRMFSSMWQCWAVLKEECSTCQRSLISRQDQLLYLITLIASSFCLLTQFMSFLKALAFCWLFPGFWDQRINFLYSWWFYRRSSSPLSFLMTCNFPSLCYSFHPTSVWSILWCWWFLSSFLKHF